MWSSTLNRAEKILAGVEKPWKMAAWQDAWVQKQILLILKRSATHRMKHDTSLLPLRVRSHSEGSRSPSEYWELEPQALLAT